MSDLITNKPQVNQQEVNKVLSDVIIDSPIGKGIRKFQIGMNIASLLLIGFLAKKYWNKSNLWKIGLLVSGAYTLRNSYKLATTTKPIVEVTKDTKLTSTPTISESDKVALFERASTYYQGGVAPSPELLKRMDETRNEAKQKIKELGLLSEYEKYAKTKATERLNMPNLPTSYSRPPLQTQPIPNDNVVASNPNTPRSVETLVSKNPIGNSESPKAKRDLYFELLDLSLDFLTKTAEDKAFAMLFSEPQKRKINSLSDEKLEVGFKNVSSQEIKEGINMLKQAMPNKTNNDTKNKIGDYMMGISNKLGDDITVINN